MTALGSSKSAIGNIFLFCYERYGENIPRYENGLESVLGSHKKYLINALRCFAFGENVAIFDVNIRRILTRVFSINFPEEAHKSEFSWYVSNLLVPESHAKQYNWAMLDLGRKVCSTKSPKCEVCPLNVICDLGQKSLQREKFASKENSEKNSEMAQ